MDNDELAEKAAAPAKKLRRWYDKQTARMKEVQQDDEDCNMADDIEGGDDRSSNTDVTD